MHRCPLPRAPAPRYPRRDDLAAAAVACALVAGCEPPQILGDMTAPSFPYGPEACMQLDPEVVDLGLVQDHASRTEVGIDLYSACAGDLEIYDIDLEHTDHTGWAASAPTKVLVPSEGTTSLTVSFGPWTPGVWDNALLVETNDPDRPIAVLPLLVEVVEDG